MTSENESYDKLDRMKYAFMTGSLIVCAYLHRYIALVSYGFVGYPIRRYYFFRENQAGFAFIAYSHSM